jgi:pimeloyl-ACP methyl ester carboxylesterase
LGCLLKLHVHQWGRGPRVVLVHGGVLGGRETWRAQRPLTGRWTLVAPDRPGHGRSPDARQDFETEAPLIADQLLREPAHVVGFSYGAIVAALAAATRPATVRSLTLIEPPSVRAARDDPVVRAWGADLTELFAAPGDDPRSLLGSFFELNGIKLAVPEPLPAPLERGVRALSGARSPAEAELPLERLAASPFPCLVISGGHHHAYEAICDAIVVGTGAERAVIAGGSHLIPDTGEPFNRRLEEFLLEVG